MRVADYIWKTLADFRTEHVFLVTGGGAMHLNDALGKEKRIKYVCNLHEQACAIAAEGYARISGKPGVINVTTGPGGTNALTGVLGAWLDSVPMIIISGQIKRSTMITSCPNLKLRQLGDQEFNIVDAVKPMTKMAKTIMSLDEVPRILMDAWKICQEGRPGPVWIDVPLDIQAMDCTNLFGNLEIPNIQRKSPDIKDILTVKNILKTSQRPVIIVGSGIRNSHAKEQFIEFARKFNIPVLTSISGIDLIESNDQLFFGRPGILGDRAANFIMQNSDMLLVVGTRMGLRICGYAYDTIAPKATKIMIDIDDAELNKPTFKPDIKICSDAKEFLIKLLNEDITVTNHDKWIEYCKNIKAKYPIITSEHRNRTDYVSSYVLPEKIVNATKDKIVAVTANGVAYTSTFQAIPIVKDMRLFANEGCASMGYGLPAAIGAAYACNNTIICFEGDGSIQMNIQELQTVVAQHLPIKIFVYNNDGYLSIKTTQNSFFDGNFVGSEPSSGVILPSLEKLAIAYGIKYFKITNNDEADLILKHVFENNEPNLIEVMLDPFEKLGPKAASKKLNNGQMISLPLENMAPFLSPEEINENMII